MRASSARCMMGTAPGARCGALVGERGLDVEAGQFVGGAGGERPGPGGVLAAEPDSRAEVFDAGQGEAERVVVIAACCCLERAGHRQVGLVLEVVAVGEFDARVQIGGGRGVASERGQDDSCDEDVVVVDEQFGVRSARQQLVGLLPRAERQVQPGHVADRCAEYVGVSECGT